MIKIIKELISENKYSDALEIINNELTKRNYDYSKEEDSKTHSELLSLRITINNQLNKIDDAVLHLSRKELVPYIKKIELQPNKFVHLIDKNVFMFKCDAFVNSIHKDKDKYFNYSERSFSHILQKSIGKKEIDRQISAYDDINKKGYLVLNHPKLMAQMSYHIPAIYGLHRVNTETLKIGLKKVLADITKRELQTIGFAALGMGGTKPDPKSNTDDYTTDEREIVNAIADTISEYFREQKNKFTPDIYFAFINFRSFQLFETIFKNKTREGKIFVKLDKEISEIQERLINDVGTKNGKYISILKGLVYAINEEESILLLGETGVGKSFLAKKYHKLSSRYDESKDNLNFNSLNCATLTKNSMYSNIFGFVKGSFTGADHDGKSIFEVVEKGTVFLDEIGYVDLATQRSLLTLVEDREYKKYGDQTVRKANVRIIFGTNQDLESLVQQGLFSLDMYARIANEYTYTIPPLKERPEDIEGLVSRQISDLNAKKGLTIKIEKDAEDQLKEYPWPENVRQLLSYIRKLFFEASKLKSRTITKALILEYPPREIQLQSDNKLELLEQLIKKYLEKWDFKNDGKFRDNFIEPLISKVFLEDLKFNKTKSNAILGIDGDHKGSNVEKLSEKYKEIKKKLK